MRYNIMNNRTLLGVAVAALFFASAAHAQTSGTVTNHAFVIGKGAGQTGYTSLLCGSAQLAVGQAAADPICRTLTGDVTLSAAGVTAIGAGKVLGSMLGAMSSAELRGALSDETGTGAAYFVGGALGTPASGTLTNASGLPVAGIAAVAANTIIANVTGSSASPTASNPSTWTQKASPTTSDLIPIVDVAASNALKHATIADVVGSIGTGVTTLDGQAGALQRHSQPQGRLTTTTATPVLTATTNDQGTVYYTPYVGDMVPIYDGTNMTMLPFTELSQATTDTTKSPAAAANNSNYDIFVWNDGGTLRATRGPAWTNDTTRSAGTALTMVKGILLNNASITNGPAASRGTYVGTIRTDGSAQVDYQFGAAGASCTAGNFGIWNMYNRVRVTTQVRDTTDNWTYATANTWRAANNSATCRVSAVRGLDEDGITAFYFGFGQAGAASVVVAGVGLNSTTAFAGTTYNNANSSSPIPLPASYTGLMGLGYVFVSPIEYNTTTTAGTWFGDAGVVYLQTGFSVTLVQ